MSDDSLKTRQTLLLRIRDEGDERAWAEFMELYAAFIFNYCRKQGLQTADTEDVVQEVFRAVAKSIRGFDYDPAQGTFRSWLFRVVRSKLANHFNKQKRHPTTPGETQLEYLADQESEASADEAADWELEYKRRVFQWATERVQSEFKENTWRAFWMSAVEEKSPADIAGELGISTGAVYIAKSRVVARLRKEVEAATGELDGLF
ncbi:MAG: RNA polymerase sigma factor (sigma-70 family) [Verrucomicrobiales bacterium]|jgi:RNA polymerase sigma factor (sigma-70 family)